MGRQALLSPLLLAHAARGHWDVGERRDGLEVRARARVASDARQRRGHARARARPFLCQGRLWLLHAAATTCQRYKPKT